MKNVSKSLSTTLVNSTLIETLFRITTWTWDCSILTVCSDSVMIFIKFCKSHDFSNVRTFILFHWKSEGGAYILRGLIFRASRYCFWLFHWMSWYVLDGLKTGDFWFKYLAPSISKDFLKYNYESFLIGLPFLGLV